MPSDTNAYELRAAIQVLGTEAYDQIEHKAPLLHELFIKKARRHPFKLSVADARSGSLNNLKALVGSIILARKLKPLLDDDEQMIESYAALKDLDIGDFIGVHGTVKRTQKGEITIFAESWTLLTKTTRALPEKYHGLTDVETRYGFLPVLANVGIETQFF